MDTQNRNKDNHAKYHHFNIDLGWVGGYEKPLPKKNTKNVKSPNIFDVDCLKVIFDLNKISGAVLLPPLPKNTAKACRASV